jgi:hypothetical protein
MGRFSANRSYGHSICRMGSNWYRLSWAYDRYFKNSRLRHPQGQSCFTDLAGAKRFAEKWGCSMPIEPDQPPK